MEDYRGYLLVWFVICFWWLKYVWLYKPNTAATIYVSVRPVGCQLAELASFLWFGAVAALQIRENSKHFYDVETLFYMLGDSFGHSNLVRWLITHLVTNSEQIQLLLYKLSTDLNSYNLYPTIFFFICVWTSGNILLIHRTIWQQMLLQNLLEG